MSTTTLTLGKTTTKDGSGSKGAWRRFAVKVDDKWASTFDRTVGNFLMANEGNEVELETETKGDFLNILSAKAAMPAPLDPLTVSAQGPTPAAKHAAIANEVALKCAVDYATGLGNIGNGHYSTVEEVILIAGKFAAFIVGDEEGPEGP